uniref:EOG090X0GPG n=1 Tax=Scapholeberis mucronata TaxID=202097 RepID=A0A4Y7NL96_9CRUS|nr:EOG090X0GPG [Scapholeberis mucronata]SVE93962.1 EOG090X0GPG [Scapholeberis mucronata]
MSDIGNKRKARDKAFYIKSAKQARRSAGELLPGIKGFLCTSNREKDSVREAYNLLNEHADILYGSEIKEEGIEEKKGLEIEDELSQEMENLKKKAEKSVSERRFQSVATGVKGCLFIRSTVKSPTEVVDAIIDEIEKKKLPSTKFLLRMLPIQATCKSSLEEILKSSDKLIEQMGKSKTFSLIVKVRNHNLKRDEIIGPVADMVKKAFPDIKVDLDNPETSLIVEVLRGTTCLAVVSNYSQRAKYNLVEIAQKTNKPSTDL